MYSLIGGGLNFNCRLGQITAREGIRVEARAGLVSALEEDPLWVSPLTPTGLVTVVTVLQ